MNWGLGSAPEIQALINAYGISREKKYADAIATSCAMTLGGNPLNTVWLAGLGEKRC